MHTFTKTFSAVISLLIAYAIGFVILKGIGAHISFFQVILVVFFITLCGASKKAFWFFLFPLITLYALYIPVGLTYGGINYDFIIAGISTDTLEAGEFLHQIPYKNYIYPFLIIGGLIVYRFIIVKFDIHFFKNRTFLFVAVVTLVLAQSPMLFLRDIKKSITPIYNEYLILNDSLKEQEWGDSTLLNSNYENYVLIIGESARRDYHHAYGYPIENTPFMSTANGTLIKGLTSGGSSTVPSLKAMLTLSNKETWDADYTKTLIGLAQSADIKTYWLSNQGYFGHFDTPISALASKSDNTIFLKYGSYESKNTSDNELLPHFYEIINNNPHEKKLIIIHLYGSHPNACDRVIDHTPIHSTSDPYYEYLNCYVNSIHKTDQFIQKIHESLTNEFITQDVPFSMIYFADHGMAHREINDVMYFNNNRLSSLHYEIPLFITNSDTTERKSCESFKSGLNFINGIGNWLGISNDLLDPEYSLFDCKDDSNDFGLSKRLEGIEPDYAIDIRDK